MGRCEGGGGGGGVFLQHMTKIAANSGNSRQVNRVYLVRHTSIELHHFVGSVRKRKRNNLQIGY